MIMDDEILENNTSNDTVEEVETVSEDYISEEAINAQTTASANENRIEDNTLKNPEPKTCPKFEIYFDKAGLYRYRLIASNGESVCMSEEGYKSKSGVVNGIKSVAINSQEPEIVDETVG